MRTIAALLRRFDIRTRMLGAIAVVLALLAMLAGAGWWSLHRIGEAGARLAQADPAEADRMVRLIAQADWLFGIGCAIAVIVVVPLTLANMASICGPIDRARQLAERIATGDLTTAVHDEGSDEAARLLRELQAMQASLRRIVTQVHASAESIQVAAAQVASGNQDLSARTEQTASNLQQAAGSMEQITGTVRQSAETATQADRLAGTASAAAERGGEVVTQVVTTMQEISASSHRIAEIIGTIDGIAFQTNILALNAAVEAARAGEQGRGFAVVAGEVRALAQRSAAAAREIKTLIDSSVARVEAGSQLAQGAGTAMTDIVDGVQRVTQMIAGISAAAAEQRTGLELVNGSVAQLDQATQQNAALVEQAAAAADSLKDQSRELARLVAGFRLEAAA
ncbi:MAG: methyl-accepting chemotaxis protein [Burkholderiaceae bacterium]